MNSDLKDIAVFTDSAIDLLKKLIEIPSISGQEDKTADLIQAFLKDHVVVSKRQANNVWAANKYYDPKKLTILLNSHHDTVKPNAGWQKEPFKADLQENKLSGLGSNDAGGALVSLMAAFLYFYPQQDLKYNLIMSATAEEETSGPNSIRAVLKDFGPIDMAIVGEPTGMQMAIAEKGLLVLHCHVTGVAGHAARGNGINAITEAIKDIEWLHTYTFDRESELLGPVKMTVTGINAGIQHNIIPDSCSYMVDVRSTDAYSNAEILEIIKNNVRAEVAEPANNLNPSGIPETHPLALAAKKLAIPMFASPTLSDQSQIPYPSVKIGPGLSERSHTADEFIYTYEIEQGIAIYIQLLAELLKD